MLLACAQGLAAGGKHGRPTEIRREILGGGSHGSRQMLAIVEDQQPRCCPQVIADAAEQIVEIDTHAQCGGDGMHHELGIVDRGKVDEAWGPVMLAGDPFSRRQCDGRLAHASGPDDRDQWVLRNGMDEGYDIVIAADEPSGATERILDRSRPSSRRRPGATFDRHRRGEAVATSGDVQDAARIVEAHPQYPAQRRDMDLQIALMDEGIWPHIGFELGLGDQFPGALDQQAEDVERAAANPDGPAGAQQDLPVRKEAEFTKLVRPLGRSSPCGAFSPCITRDNCFACRGPLAASIHRATATDARVFLPKHRFPPSLVATLCSAPRHAIAHPSRLCGEQR